MQSFRWNRQSLLPWSWPAHETVERLVTSASLRERVERITRGFAGGQTTYPAMGLSWRRGLLLFGPAGGGKTAFGRAIARLLTWEHYTIPAHEILDSHLLEKALWDCTRSHHRVVVLEDVDRMLQRMETEEFFELLDHAMERVEGVFWIATTSRPEASPKTQLVRPGRFDESIRLDLPTATLRQEILMNDFVVPFFPTLSDDEEKLLLELVELTSGLSFAHFAEMRGLAARLKLDGRESELWNELRSYIQDQIISADRSGGLSNSTTNLKIRVQEVDARVLTAALDMTDVLGALMEKTVADALVEQSRESSSESKV